MYNIKVGDIVRVESTARSAADNWPKFGFISKVYHINSRIYIEDTNSPYLNYGKYGWGYLPQSVVPASKEEIIKYMNKNHLPGCVCYSCKGEVV